jgi:hypothetical protein
MFTTTLHSGVLRYTDSPLLRAIQYGRIMVVDEADKAPEHVVAVFRSLAGEGEMTLSDGRRVRRRRIGEEQKERGRDGEVYVHPDFRLVLLANRPGYRELTFLIYPTVLPDLLHTAFLGNHFLQVLGENFSAHSVTNPDPESEQMLLGQMAPEIDKVLIRKLVNAFQDLRRGYEGGGGGIGYPYSLRGLSLHLLVNRLTKHCKHRIDQPRPASSRIPARFVGGRSKKCVRF